MAADKRVQGAAVEDAALALLLQSGLRLVSRNFNARGGELDLVMHDGQSLVFVEVRHRRSAQFGGGAASVDAGKQRRIVQAASSFLLKHHRWANAPCRFDVVDARGDPTAPQLDWIRDAFRTDDF